MKKTILFSSLLIAAVSAHATLLLEEDFNYAVGSAQTAWNGGVGMSGNLVVSSNSTGSIVNGLTLGSMPVTGGALSVSLTSTSSYDYGTVERTMTFGNVTSGDVWFSYLYQYNTSSTQSDEVSLQLRPTAGNIRNGLDEDTSAMYTRYGTDVSVSAANSIFTDGTTLLLVFLYPDLGSSTGDDAKGWAFTAAQYELLVAAGLSVENLDLYASATVTNSFAANTTMNGTGKFQIVPTARGIGTVGSFYIDELKIGTSLNDVVAVPEPSALALLGVLGSLLVARRKRAK